MTGEATVNHRKGLDPFLMAIFGASGDLTQRKLIPSLFSLFKDGWLPKRFAILGFASSDMSREEFQRKMRDAISRGLQGENIDSAELNEFIERLHYFSGRFEDPKAFLKFRQQIEEIESSSGLPGNRLFYLAIPPKFIPTIMSQMAGQKIVEERNGWWRRVIVEKPLGHDLQSFRALEASLRKVLNERQIYRIDHYLGKETVQNILIFRFANSIFEPIWNRRYIDSVQITVAEELGVEHRGAYYEPIGAFRDMVPSHLFQVMSLVAMEPPTSFEADSVRSEYEKVLQSIVPFKTDDVLQWTVRGQYSDGEIQNRHVPAYCSEEKVSPNSKTETYAALRIMIDNWRWAGVPFYLRTGKRLKKRGTEVAISFRSPPVRLFEKLNSGKLEPNQLVLRLQPEKGISLHFIGKIPGPEMRFRTVNMDFRYGDFFGSEPVTGYETLLYDCIKGDATLFRSARQVEMAFEFITPILDAWAASKDMPLPMYRAGTDGPAEADELLNRDGRQWRPL